VTGMTVRAAVVAGTEVESQNSAGVSAAETLVEVASSGLAAVEVVLAECWSH